MDSIDLGKDNAQQLNKFIELAAQCIDEDRRDDAISLLSSAISLYPASGITQEELNQTVPTRSEVLTKLGIIFSDSGTNLDPIAVHLFQQALVYDENFVPANFYLGKLLMNNGNIAQALKCMQNALDNSIEGDRFYQSAKDSLEEMSELVDHGDTIFAIDYLIGQSMSHAIIDSPIGTFKKMDFDQIENKYDGSVQLFPTEATTQKLNQIREFNSNHGFEQTSLEEFLPANLPLFEAHNDLPTYIKDKYTLVDMGAEIYDVCGLNVDPQLTFTFYKLIQRETNTYSYLLLAGKSPLEIKDKQLSRSEESDYDGAIFDIYKNRILYNQDSISGFIAALAKDYFGDQFKDDNIQNLVINGINDESFNHDLEFTDDFNINNSRVKVLIDTDIKA
ncbi:tetratricopeptide repeat protein [Apilactobacillus apinorum]|uniref:Tetratricopeptide repeat protein n=1 Tax=Apilactobacillus apinorum TaxID=1218495 RepID=A0ABP9ZH82_9LACO